MKKIFVNFTNHPWNQWDQRQREAALEYGEIIDIAFPAVDALADENAVKKLSDRYVEMIMVLQPVAVLCQGEFCLAYQVISALREKGVTVLAACSERNVKQYAGGKKEITFEFKQFRRYV